MGRFEDMKDKIMKTPTASDITPKQLKSFLDHYGFILKRSTGSHFIYEYKGTNKVFMLNIPMHNPVKPAYIDEVRKRIMEIEEE